VADRGLTGVLLVGGASRRFGSAKALAELDGETLADRAWRLLGDACDERFAVGRGIGLTFPTLPDAVFGGGPLGGIVAGLRAASHDVAVVIPVDMPLLTVASLHALADACRDVAVPQSGPLPGAYAKRALPELERALDRGDFALRHVIAGLETVVVRLADDVLANVNTRNDLERLA
jgi:molybdenum cofactor guanylyltransferase